MFRTKSRKEKNKLASRACRLKKKAQHEANKLKLHGLDEEHSKFIFQEYWYNWFHIKGTWNVHLFNGDYLSIPIAHR